MDTHPEMPPVMPPQPLTAPEVKIANRFSITMSPQDLVVTLGANRPLFHHGGEPAGAFVDYAASFSMSPIAAKQFGDALAVLLNKYEQEYGVIPVDPNAKARLQSWADEQQKSAKPATTAKRSSRAKR